MWNLPDPTIARHRNALDRATRAVEASKDLRQQLASLELSQRRPTLLGVAAQSSRAAPAHITAAALGARPNGRY